MKFLYLTLFLGFQTISFAQEATYNLDDFLIKGGAKLLKSNVFLLTENLHYKSGSIWYPEQLDLDKPFSIIMDLFFGCSDGGADGMVFVLTTNPDLGVLANGIGFRGIKPSIGLEMDTYQNSNFDDPHFDHLGMMLNGTTRHRSGSSAGRPLLFQGGNVEDCRYHSLQVDWNPRKNKLRAAFDGEWILNEKIDLSKSIFDGGTTVYWGVTGATGENRNEQAVKLKRMRFTEVMKKEEREFAFPEPVDIAYSEEDLLASRTIAIDRMIDYHENHEKYFFHLEFHPDDEKQNLEKIRKYLIENGIDENKIIIVEKPIKESTSEIKTIIVSLVEIKA